MSLFGLIIRPPRTRRKPAPRATPTDPYAHFTARDWADLPPYHPPEERDGR